MKTLNVLLGTALIAGALVVGPAVAGLVPGGPNTPEKNLAVDCFAELDVTALETATVTLNDKGVPTITCIDGGACDQDETADGKCVFSVETCINQTNVEGCTPPAGLDSLKATGKVKGQKGQVVVDAPQLLEGSVCGALVDFTVPLKKETNPGKGTISVKAKLKKNKDAGIPKTLTDKDKTTFICNPSTTVQICPDNAAGGPDKLKATIAQTGNDLDNGWTGISQNFAVTPNGSINVCLSECDTSSDTECTANGAVGAGTINGPFFGAPLPLLASNVPVCVVNRFNQVITGTANYGTGDIDLHVTLLSDVWFTDASEVCPRCGSNNRCTSGKNIDKPCTVDATLRVAEGEGNKDYNLSEDCPPLGNPLATLDIDFDPLTSGTTDPLDPTSPDYPLCQRRPGGPGITPQPNACAAGCGAPCQGNACVQMIPNPADPSEMVCLDNKGGISQMCCNDNPSRSCFPLDNGGTFTRTGRPEIPQPALPDTSFPKTGTGVLASVFCESATGSGTIDGTTGLPGPAAFLMNGIQDWTQEAQE
jgi:hypothetical protein